MTRRKPPGASFESWIDRAIADGVAKGKFDDLPGHGQPLPDIDRPHDDLWWVKDKLKREEVSFLPPSLALRREIDDAAAAAVAARSELQARRIIAEANEKVAAAVRVPPSGPSVIYRRLDTEALVEAWRQAHPPPGPPPMPEPATPARRRWWHRSRA